MSALPLTSFLIRPAQLQDITALVEVLFESFHPDQVGFKSWLSALWRLGIQADLKTRFQNAAKTHYICLVATQNPVTSVYPLLGKHCPALVGTVELALRAPAKLRLDQLCLLPTNLLIKRQSRRCYLYLSNLAVHPKFRHQGIAQQLLEACEQTARNWGFQEIYLHVLDDNYKAKRLYLKAGYRIQRVEPDWRTWVLGRARKLLLHKTLG